MFFTLCLIAVAVLLIYVYLIWNNNHWKKLGVPHIPPSVFVGNTPNAITQKRNPYYDVQDIYQKFRGKFRLAGMYNFRKPALIVLDAGLAHEVLVTNFNKFSCNDATDVIDKDIDPILGYNPFFLKGHEWKEQRAEITPAFTVARLRAMYPLIEDVCQNLRDYVDKEHRVAGSSGLEARELFAKYTTDVVSNCIFALDAGSLKDQDAVIRKMGKELLKPSLRLMFLFVVMQIWPTAQKVLRIPFVPKPVVQFFANLMRDAAQFRRNSKMAKADVLEYLLALQEKKNLNDVELVANAITFFMDGFETSSISMSLILFEVARSKRVQDKLREEILAAEMKSPLTMDTVADLPYLNQVIHEALRLNSPAGALIKRCVTDCELPLTDDGKLTVKIPVGTPVWIPLYDIHRDAANFKDPLEFNPERFDEDQGGMKQYKDKGQLLVFGDGPRICLGMRFALTQMKAGLVEILKSFEVTVNEKTQMPLVMDPKEFLNVAQGGLWVNFKKL